MIKYENILKRMRKSSNIFIVGHKNLDLDSLGSSLGLYYIALKMKKSVYIIIEDKKLEDSVEKALFYIQENHKYNIGKLDDYKDKIDKNSLLIILDTFSEKRIQCPKIISFIPNYIIIDHHLFGKSVNKNYYIDSKISSCSEIVATILKNKNYKINRYIANILLAGIYIDTNNFIIKTTMNTHLISAYLMKCGAEATIFNSFNKQNIEEYMKIQRIIFKTEFYKKKYAIVVCDAKTLYEVEDLAKIVDTLMLFEKIEVSFAIGFIDKEIIGVSARSGVKFDVNKFMKKLGGGGTKNNAATQINGRSLLTIKNQIKGELKNESNIA